MSGTRLAAALVVLVCTLSARVSAQATPEEVAQQYAEAMRQSDFAAAARLTHPAALSGFRELFAPLLESDTFDELGPALVGVKSREELAGMADTTFFAAFLRNVVGQQAAFATALQTAKTTVLGTVAGGADTSFVVSRVEMSVEGVSISQFDVMPVARHEGVWRCLLKADFANMAAMMRRMMTSREPSGAT
jgi:hypothetical protein